MFGCQNDIKKVKGPKKSRIVAWFPRLDPTKGDSMKTNIVSKDNVRHFDVRSNTARESMVPENVCKEFFQQWESHQADWSGSKGYKENY